MLVDKKRRFLLQLSLALHVPIQELEQYPASIIQEYRALNFVSPFVNDAILSREGLSIQFLRNQNITKQQHYKTADELLPYLKEYPDYLEHDLVKKVLSLLSTVGTEEAKADLLTKISEEIVLEQNKENPDKYLLFRLQEIINKAAK
ncbi:hypothetical protein M2G70_07450 [Vibrio vulnificus]|nr:hypothetical protein [Vibrio vulnificus]